MHITCKCLNVSIKTRGSQLGDFTQEIHDCEKAHPFFQQNLATATELEGISKEQSGLVECRNVGSWIVNCCLNCSKYTHAVHREHGAALVVINTDLVMSPEEMEKLKTSPNYSSIFRVVIDRGLDDGDLLEAPTKYSVSQLSSNLQLALTNLQQQLEQVVHRKATETEEKIRDFTAEQHQLLEQFREEAHYEHRLLARIICDQHKVKATSNVKADAAVTENLTPNFIASPLKLNNSKTPHRSGVMSENQAATKHPAHIHLNGDRKLHVSSYDTEALFPLEGMDDTSYVEPSHPSEDESDTDGQEEGIHIPRALRGGHPTLAKSLPVSVPNFIVRRTMQDQDDDQLPNPHNIRASIKALAKSVHGDTVFGDLPRPRFSTQI
ncbi:uncharacterized protein LOC107041275 [Diachasma alloeum]|uniref:uncharacterized protein LOC107041275 n=1 Tax=Diachasma alloeum TaxID=454923 RepID=UPI00073837D6|nr:uncharacterized protein LOC107041275 [Diachasma alloeum]XP_015117237.1 uncharacterized protein LOC107041275 [Diachasma alloeum]XP_015117238.1 uncharacterized protein LOC107041275 [Diachasma alloeum]